MQCTGVAQTNQSWHSSLEFDTADWQIPLIRHTVGLTSQSRGKSSDESPIWTSDPATKAAAPQVFCRIVLTATDQGDDRGHRTGRNPGLMNSLTSKFSGMSTLSKFLLTAFVTLALVAVGLVLRKLRRQMSFLKRGSAWEMQERLASAAQESEENILSQMFQLADDSALRGIGDDALHVNEEIGTGSYGVVYRAQWGRATVAVKQLKLTKQEMDMVQKVMGDFKAEVSIMSKLDHPHIVAMLGYSMVRVV
eukprot:SAG31_NODE_3092_length_4683_cov_2.003927_4_plen_250_part_00